MYQVPRSKYQVPSTCLVSQRGERIRPQDTRRRKGIANTKYQIQNTNTNYKLQNTKYRYIYKYKIPDTTCLVSQKGEEMRRHDTRRRKGRAGRRINCLYVPILVFDLSEYELLKEWLVNDHLKGRSASPLSVRLHLDF